MNPHACWLVAARQSGRNFEDPPGLTVPTVLLSEKYSCTDHASTIAKHFPYGTSVCSSLTSENFGQNRYRKSGVSDLVCPIQYMYEYISRQRAAGPRRDGRGTFD